MWLIVGLGNIGEEYKKTRHNIGFMMLDFLSSSFKESKKVDGFIAKETVHEQKVLLLKPTTFMNNSGISVNKTLSFYDISSSHLIVIHDDSDIAFGDIKVQKARNAAGHNGVQSIIDQIKTNDFYRIRIGIRPQNNTQKSETFVLKPFSKEEKTSIPTLKEEVISHLFTLLKN